MKAEETVMTLDQYNMFALDFHQVNNIMELYTKCEFINRYEQAKLARQAEITWKARDGEIEVAYKAGQQNGLSLERQGEAYCLGVMAGQQEVVEWGDEVCTHFNHSFPYVKGRLRRMCNDCWQAQCKVWGIKPKENMPIVSNDERIYPCAMCGELRSKNEGGTTFTVCDKCWDKTHKKPKPNNVVGDTPL